MWRITAVVGLAALMGIAALSMKTHSVHACPPPIGDPLVGTEIIVEGRVVTYTAHAPADVEKVEGYLVREEFTVEIVQVLVGELDSKVVTVNQSAAVGAFVTDCDAFARDIEGQYIVMGLRELDDGTYGSLLFNTVFIGPEPEGEAYEAVIRRIANLSVPILPSTGTGPTLSTTANHLLLTIAAAGVALLATAGALRYRPRRIT